MIFPIEFILRVLVTTILTTLILVNGQKRGECCQDYCYAADNEQSAHFASKTPYTVAKGPENQRQYFVPNCNATKIWILSRHGIRLPPAKAIERLKKLADLKDEIIENYEKRHSKPAIGAMCEKDLDLLRNWKWDPNITTQYADTLTTQGWDELKFLAIRYQKMFPNILPPAYKVLKFLFRYTKSQRAEASYKAFAEGLFGPNGHETINIQPPPDNDTLLRPYELCPAFNKFDSKGDGTEYKKFANSHTIIQLISDLSQRLGFKFPLKMDQVLEIFEMCRYNQAWDLYSPSPWCAAFTPTQIDDLEYLEDLDTYYESGFGRPINSHIQCAAMNDMLHHLDSQTQPDAIVYFTHAKSILTLLTALNAVRDTDSLRSDNYYSMTRRMWRLSEISPFASNLAAIKYDCPNENEREKVMFFLNEKPLKFDWCKVGLCNLTEIKERYKVYSQANCDEFFCSGGTSGAAKLFTYVSILVTAATITSFILA